MAHVFWGSKIACANALKISKSQIGQSTNTMRRKIHWLLVWNILYDFLYIGNVIIPTDELHHFSER